MLLSNRTPVGANGVKLENKGDVIGQIEIGKNLHTARFTIIHNLCHDVILGSDVLGSLGFYIHPNCTKVEIAGTAIGRIFDETISIQCVQTINDLNVNAKNLCITQEETQEIGRSVEDTNYKVDVAANGQCFKATNGPTETYPTDHISETMNKIKPVGVSQYTELTMVESGYEPNMLQADNKEDMRKLKTLNRLNVNDYDGDTDVDGDHHGSLDDIQGCALRKIEYKDMDESNLDHIEIRLVENLLQKYNDIFSLSDNDLGLFRACDDGPSTVTFHLKDPTKVCYSIPRRVPYGRREWLEQKLEDLEQADIIKEVTYGDDIIHTSPIVIVPKKHGKFRMAVDYRILNENLKLETMPLPNVKECIEKLSGMRFFTALDITSAFHQLELCDNTKRLMAFVTLGRRFITKRMPFGAHPCPAKFQETMMRVYKSIPTDRCTIYMDDILVSSPTFEEHLKDLEDVFIQTRRHGLKLSPSKCTFFQPKIEYLGYIVGDHNGKFGYSPLPGKIEALANTSLPQTAKEVRSFTGGLQYYNAMIKNLNVTLGPLHKGAAKVPFVMTDAMTKAFYTVKDMLQEKVMLAFPNFNLTFKLSTDASFAGAAGVLSQIHPDGDEEIIYTFSKAFDEVQTKWAIVELEALALVWSLDKMKELLLGRRFIWLTDSLVLKNMILKPSHDLSRSGRKIQRYIDFINQFNMEIRHEKGTEPETQLADFLSRTPVAAVKNLFRVQITVDEWIKAVQNDQELCECKNEWRKYQKKLFTENGVVYMHSTPRCKIAVPRSLQITVVEYYHTSFTLHGGISRLVQLITGLYVWPNMYQTIKQYVNSCQTCLKSKTLPMQSGMKKAIETPTRAFEWIQIDLVTVSNKKSDRGNRYILTCICCLTNFVQMEPIPSKETVVVLKALCRIFCNCGIPKIIQSDNGREFDSKIMQTHAKWLDVEWRFSTPYKPSTNGRIERRHADLGKLLKILNCDTGGWCEELPYICFELNAAVDRVTGISPFEQFHGWSPRIPHLVKDVEMATPFTNFHDWCHQLERQSWESTLRDHQNRAFKSINEQRSAYKEQTALAGDILPQLVPGDYVMVKLPGTGKLEPKLHGPYEILKINVGGSFTARELDGTKVVRLPAQNARRIKLDIEPKLDGKAEISEPNAVEEQVKSGMQTKESPFLRRTRKKNYDFTKFF